MLIGGAAPRKTDRDHAPTGSFVAFSGNAITWTAPKIVAAPGRWLWRVTSHGGKAYGIAYASTRPPNGDLATQLLTSDDGLHYSILASRLFTEPIPTEATIRFGDNGTMYCLQRRDGQPRFKSAYFGVSLPPYTAWQWHDLGQFVGGPNFIGLPTGQWIAAGRFYDGNTPKTKLAALDVRHATIQPILELPSGGDSGYPGLVWHDNTLWVSYYLEPRRKNERVLGQGKRRLDLKRPPPARYTP